MNTDEHGAEEVWAKPFGFLPCASHPRKFINFASQEFCACSLICENLRHLWIILNLAS